MHGQTILLGTATPGSGFPLYGGAFAESVNAANAFLVVEPRNTKGSTEKAGDGPLMVAEGRVAALWGAGIGWPGFAAVASSPAGARFIVPDAAEIASKRRWRRSWNRRGKPRYENTYAAAPRTDLIHAGVLRYLAEIGIARA